MKTDSRPKAVVSWSSGKNCAFALHQVREQGQFEVVGLLITFNAENVRVAMHGVRRQEVQLQMQALVLPAEMVMCYLCLVMMSPIGSASVKVSSAFGILA